MKKTFLLAMTLLALQSAQAKDHDNIVSKALTNGNFTLIEKAKPLNIVIDASQLKGKVEKYLMTVVQNPADGVDEALVIAGSDMRGTIYGIYKLSEQIGVSPWYDWMDVPVMHQENLSLVKGTYTALGGRRTSDCKDNFAQ